MRTLRYLAIVIASVIPYISLNAQTGSFLNVPEGAEELSMGGMNAVGDAAGLLEDTKLEASVSYFKWAPKGTGDNIATFNLGYHLDKLAIFGKGGMDATGSYQIFDESGAPGGIYKPMDYYVGVGAGYAITPGLSVSVLAKLVGSNLAPEAKSTAFCADINAAYKVKSLTIGLLAANIGTKLHGAPLPMMLRLGAENGFEFGEKFGLDLGLEAGYLAQGQRKAFIAAAGADFRMFNMLSIRAGYHFSSDINSEPSYISTGLGLDISKVSVSAAYLIGSGPISGTICATLGLKF